MQAFCILSDSGTITEEASILNLPAVMIRQAHERPEGMDGGTLIMGGLKSKRVLQAINIVTTQLAQGQHIHEIAGDYDVRDVSKQVVRVIMSYVDYINRTMWFRTVYLRE